MEPESGVIIKKREFYIFSLACYMSQHFTYLLFIYLFYCIYYFWKHSIIFSPILF